jgi:hypothetical protein
MATGQLVRLLMDALTNLGTFVVLIAATVLVVVLWRRKEGGTGGAFVLMLARTGVWLSTLGFLVNNVMSTEIGYETTMWIGVGLRVLLLLSTALSILGFLLIKPAKPAARPQEAPHG